MKAHPARRYLALITASAALFLSLFGLVFQNSYTARINQITRYELMGQDIVTAIVAAVFVVIVLFLDDRKIKTQVAWLGCLLYFFYIYAYFSFGGISSRFYLLYIAIAGLSGFQLCFLLAEIAGSHQFPEVTERYPRKALSVFFFVSILLITAIEVQELVAKTILAQEPLNPFYVFYVLDLAFVFPMIVIAGILNLMKAAWGHLLSGVALIKIITILPAVIFNDLFHRLYTGVFLDLSFDLIALTITAIASVFLVLYLKTVQDKRLPLTQPLREKKGYRE